MEKNIPKSAQTLQLEKDLKEVNDNIAELENKDKENALKMIALSLAGGVSEAKLLGLGFTQEEINEAKGGQTTPQPASTPDTTSKIEPVNKNKEQQDKLFQMILARIEERKADREKLTYLKEHLAQLLLAKESEESSNNSGEVVENNETELDQNEEVTSPQEQSGNLNTSAELKEEYMRLEKELNGISMFKIGAIRKKKKEMEQVWEKYNQTKSREIEEKIQKTKEEIIEDRKMKPFLYYAAEKAPNIEQALKRSDIDGIDLRWSGPDNFYGTGNYLQFTGENEGFFDFSILGFTKVIKNVSELREEGGINVRSPKAIYKIVGPDGTIIADNIKGYDEATRIFVDATEEHKIKVENEYNDSQKE